MIMKEIKKKLLLKVMMDTVEITEETVEAEIMDDGIISICSKDAVDCGECTKSSSKGKLARHM